MNKFKRITAMFMVILTLFSSLSMMTVNAATEGTKTTIDASYRCYKGSDVGTSGTAPIGNKNYYWHYNADGTALNCPIRFLKEAGTGLAVYCIEVGATFSGYTYDTKNLTDSPYWNSLSYTAQTGITYSTMYGYPGLARSIILQLDLILRRSRGSGICKAGTLVVSDDSRRKLIVCAFGR